MRLLVHSRQFGKDFFFCSLVSSVSTEHNLKGSSCINSPRLCTPQGRVSWASSHLICYLVLALKCLFIVPLGPQWSIVFWRIPPTWSHKSAVTADLLPARVMDSNLALNTRRTFWMWQTRCSASWICCNKKEDFDMTAACMTYPCFNIVICIIVLWCTNILKKCWVEVGLGGIPVRSKNRSSFSLWYGFFTFRYTG